VASMAGTLAGSAVVIFDSVVGRLVGRSPVEEKNGA